MVSYIEFQRLTPEWLQRVTKWQGILGGDYNLLRNDILSYKNKHFVSTSVDVWRSPYFKIFI